MTAGRRSPEGGSGSVQKGACMSLQAAKDYRCEGLAAGGGVAFLVIAAAGYGIWRLAIPNPSPSELGVFILMAWFGLLAALVGLPGVLLQWLTTKQRSPIGASITSAAVSIAVGFLFGYLAVGSFLGFALANDRNTEHVIAAVPQALPYWPYPTIVTGLLGLSLTLWQSRSFPRGRGLPLPFLAAWCANSLALPVLVAGPCLIGLLATAAPEVAESVSAREDPMSPGLSRGGGAAILVGGLAIASAAGLVLFLTVLPTLVPRIAVKRLLPDVTARELRRDEFWDRMVDQYWRASGETRLELKDLIRMVAFCGDRKQREKATGALTRLAQMPEAAVSTSCGSTDPDFLEDDG